MIDPSRAIAAVVGVALLAALLPFSASVSAQAGNPVITIGEVPGASGFPIETGTSIFDGLGECVGTPAAPPVPYPGNDCSSGDNVVRTNDIVSYGTSVSVSNLLGVDDPGGPEHVDDVHFTQQITPTGPDAVVEFVELPPTCRTGTNPDTGVAFDPQSSVNPLPGGGQELVCNLGRLTGPTQTVFMRPQVTISTQSKNDASFTSTNAICPDTDAAGDPLGGCTVVTERDDVDGVDIQDRSDDSTTYISALPRFDLAKDRLAPKNIGAIQKPNDTPTRADDEFGVKYIYYVTLEADAQSDGKGGMNLTTDPLEFQDILYLQGTTTPIPDFELGTFGANGSASTPCNWLDDSLPIPYGQQDGGVRNATNSVGDSGTWTCTQASPGAPIQISITGADTSGSTYPDFASNNTTALTPPYYVISGWVSIWIPFSVIDRYSPGAGCNAAETAAGYDVPFCASVNNSGSLPIANCYVGFDPDATDANGDPVSNYGDGIEPGTYGTGGGNNCHESTLRLRTSGAFQKHYVASVSESVGLDGVPPGQTAYRSGDGPIEPSQYLGIRVRYNNTGTTPQTNVVLCENIDNMTTRVAPIQAAGGWVPTNPSGFANPAFVRSRLDYPADQSDLIIEYASGPAGTVAPAYVQWDNDHLIGGTNAFTGLFDSATSGTQQASNCSDAEGNWNTDPYSFDPDPATSLDKVRAVRVRHTDDYVLNGGARLTLKIQIQGRNNFFGGPYDGQLIPVGTITPNYTSRHADQMDNGDWSSPSYDPNTTLGSDGDRLLSSRGHTLIEKYLVPYNTHHSAVDPVDYLSAQGGLSGTAFQFRLLPAAISNLTSPASALTGVTVTDVLPNWLSYDPACTALVSAYPAPIQQSDTPSAGQTTLIWNLGSVVPNTQLDPIDFCVTSSNVAPDGTNAVNTVVIDANEDITNISQRTASATVQLSQLGQFRMAKQVDDNLDPSQNPQTYTVEWINSSEFVDLDPPVLIDVFPHNLDGPTEGSGAPRSPESDYTGTLELSGPAAATDAGDFLYTKRNSYEIDQDPANATNPFDGPPFDATNPNLGSALDSNNDGEADSGRTIWCLSSDFGATGCPAGFTEANALMFVGSEIIGAGDTGELSFTLNPAGNDSGDFYSNRASGFTPSLPDQLNLTNSVTVEVLSMSIGDFVWYDDDNDGTYDPSQGEVPVPDGVVVELRDPTGTTIATTTTTNGRYLFDRLEAGSYQIAIPASQFLSTGPLTGFVPSTPSMPADDDENESVDQQGTLDVSGDVVTDLVTLSFTANPPNPLTGDIAVNGHEPAGDDIAFIDLSTRDDLSNLTVDIGLVGPARIELIKLVNNDDANTAPGVHVQPGSTATFSFTVTNPSRVDLTDVTITDNKLASSAISCPAHHSDVDGDNIIDTLLVGETITCSASAVTVTGLHTNTARVEGTSPADETVSDEDVANYLGVIAAITVEKSTELEDADTAPGPAIPVGDPVGWKYLVTNTGNVDLALVNVTDDQLLPAAIDCGSGTNVITLLEPGPLNAVTCLASGIATSGQYENIASATGEPVDPEGNPVPDIDDPEASDPSHYFGIGPSITIEKSTSGEDADVAPGPSIALGEPVNWSYQVTNDGNLPLAQVTVTDDQLLASEIVCEDHLGDTDANNVIDLIAPGESVECVATGIATLGPYQNTGSVAGDPMFFDEPDPLPEVTNSDPSHYVGVTDKLKIEKATNGHDADTAPGPAISEGSSVVWTYTVANGTNSAMTSVHVTDNLVASSAISCASHLGDTNGDNIIDLLLPTDVVVCTADSNAALAGQYANIGSVLGQPVSPISPDAGFDPNDPSTYPTQPEDYEPSMDESGQQVPQRSDEDPSHYFGLTVGLDIEKYVDGQDADTAPGITVTEGDAIEWTYVVTNTGTSALTAVEVHDDDPAVIPDCGGSNVIALLLPGQTIICSASGIAVNGQYQNIADAIGNPAAPPHLTGDPTDPAAWPKDPEVYVPLADFETGTPVDRPTDNDPAHHVGVPTTASPPELRIQKSVDKQVLNAGSTAVFTIVVQNNGGDTATSVTVTDTFPDGLRHVADLSGTISSSQGASEAERIWNLGDIAPGGTVTFSYNTQVATGASGSMENIASVSANEDEPAYSLGDNEDRASISVNDTTQPNTPLAFSGADTGGTTLAGLLLLVIGLALLSVSRRLRPRR